MSFLANSIQRFLATAAKNGSLAFPVVSTLTTAALDAEWISYVTVTQTHVWLPECLSSLAGLCPGFHSYVGGGGGIPGSPTVLLDLINTRQVLPCDVFLHGHK